MIRGERPGPERTDPVGVAPVEVVALAARCARLEAALEFYALEDRYDVDETCCAVGWQRYEGAPILSDLGEVARAALSAAGAATDQGDGEA